jgi:ParB-like chromosome segregation protein Spo0J
MKTVEVNIGDIRENPNNPRLIKDDKFKKLVQSIKDFPQMLAIRPIVVNADMTVLGGNMRLKACKEAGLEKVPVIMANDLTEEQQKEFIIKDNVGFGEWDWDIIANEWDAEQLTDWGLDIPNFMTLPSDDELIGEDKNKPPVMKITFESPEQLQQAENDIIELIDRKYKGAFYSVSAGEI